MSDLVNLLILALATWQAVEICRHGSIFAGVRAGLESRGGRFSDLFLCPFCLSVWMAASMFVLWNAPALRLPGFPSNFAFDLLTLPVWAFAISRLANLLNDICHDLTRTPKEEDYIAQGASNEGGNDSE